MEKIEVGAVRNTHGLHGEIKVVSFCDSPDFFEGFSKLWINGREYTPGQVRYQKDHLILSLRGVTTIEQAELLKQKIIFAAKQEVVDQLEEDRYLITDLLGLSVYENENKLGVLKDVLQTGANDVYIVSTPSGKELLLPVIDQVVKEIDLAAGRIEVQLMEGMEEQ